MTATAPAGYSRAQKVLHWAVVLLLLAQYLVFDAMGDPFRRTLEAGGPVWVQPAVAHAITGTGILALTLARLALRVPHGAPAERADEPRFTALAARVTHAGLYASLIGLPLTGMVAWAGGFASVGGVHALWTNLLLALVALHVAAVLAHQFWWRTPVLQRMT